MRHTRAALTFGVHAAPVAAMLLSHRRTKLVDLDTNAGDPVPRALLLTPRRHASSLSYLSVAARGALLSFVTKIKQRAAFPRWFIRPPFVNRIRSASMKTTILHDDDNDVGICRNTRPHSCYVTSSTCIKFTSTSFFQQRNFFSR